VRRKREVVLRLLRGESMAALSRELGVEIYRLEKWRDKALAGIETALKKREGDPLKEELDAALKRIGELTMTNELLRTRIEKPGPFGNGRSRR
jgi:transposase-like protein